MNPNLTPAEALKEIQRLLKDDTDTIPEGWYAIPALAIEWRLSEQRTAALCADALNKGVAERRKFRINASSVVRPVWHYKFHARPLASPPPTPMAPRMPERLAS